VTARIAEIQAAVSAEGFDGWLFMDHHRRDPLAYRILNFEPPRIPTRRWYYLIPAKGEPRGLVHRVEATMLDALPGDKLVYSSWRSHREGLARLLAGLRTVAMQYSPDCAIPYVAMVDAGTVELVRSFGIQVSSSADLVQYFEARWTDEQLECHLEAGRRVDAIRREAFRHIAAELQAGRRTSEWAIKHFILEAFQRERLLTDHGPIVAVNDNSANPHYEPSPESSREIRSGDWVLIDLWAKLDRPEAVYYDSTWVGYCGAQAPWEIIRVFDIVREARDRAIRLVQDAVRRRQTLRGFEVDDAARDYIREQGLAERFIHRTGHSIGRDVHGAGANMDNLETHDERRIIPRTGFSIEPGIYLDKFGVRSEVNVFVGDEEAVVTGEIQQAPVTILRP